MQSSAPATFFDSSRISVLPKLLDGALLSNQLSSGSMPPTPPPLLLQAASPPRWARLPPDGGACESIVLVVEPLIIFRTVSV